MKKLMIGVTALVALSLPLSAVAAPSPSDYKNAAKFCKALRADPELGGETFKAAYGTNKKKSNAFGKCVSKQARAEDGRHDDAVNECKTERAAGADAFQKTYGTGKGKNAFGKCVSQKKKAEAEDDHDSIVNAAKQCKALRKNERAAFDEKYGTRRNAFGKCVSRTARSLEAEKEKTETPPETPPAGTA
jgi:hypothetical protein